MGYRRVKECAVCGKEFEVTVHNKKYCSRACVNKRMSEHQRLMYQKRKRMPKEGYLLKCGFCGEEFRSERSNRVYCSDTCKRNKAKERDREYYAKKKDVNIKKYDDPEEEKVKINPMFLRRGKIHYAGHRN